MGRERNLEFSRDRILLRASPRPARQAAVECNARMRHLAAPPCPGSSTTKSVLSRTRAQSRGSSKNAVVRATAATLLRAPGSVEGSHSCEQVHFCGHKRFSSSNDSEAAVDAVKLPLLSRGVGDSSSGHNQLASCQSFSVW